MHNTDLTMARLNPTRSIMCSVLARDGFGVRRVGFPRRTPDAMTDLRHRRQRVAVVAWLSKTNLQPGQVSDVIEQSSQLAASLV
jgi:predicted RNA binding protein YcfA (HicA-like mRNA interferase family)